MHHVRIVALIAAVCSVALAPTASAAPNTKRPTPVIFVHGNSGSAQQFETNAMRLTSNGFPQGRIFAYEYDTSGSTNDLAIANLDGFIAAVKAQTGANQVDVLAHSRGTTVMHAYLATPERAASVRRYVNFDGRTSETQPGGVPTLAVWGEGDQSRTIGGAENLYFPGKAHTEVTTSAEAFAKVYAFLLGAKPKTKQVVAEKPSKVKVRGRALIFPNNTGNDGAMLRVYLLNDKNGQRAAAKPVYEKALDATGNFGPFKVNARRHYEFEMTRPDASTIHNYPEPFERDNYFYRVLTAPALDPFIERSPNHVSVAVTRMREFWADEPAPAANDTLTFNGFNALSPATAPRARRVLAVFNFDKNSDGVSDTSAALAPFSSIGFLTGVDNYMPASPDASGKIAVTEKMRAPRAQTETINVPNWPSDQHTVSVYFKDYDAKAYKKKRR